MSLTDIIFRFWTPFKILLATKGRRKQTTRKELKCVRDFMDKNNLWSTQLENFHILDYFAYKSDGIFDFQKTACQTIKDKGGDCEDLHRVAQLIISELLDISTVYLIQVSAKKKSHAFVGYGYKGLKYLFDYDKIFNVNNLHTGAKQLMIDRYKATPESIYITDLSWNRVTQYI